jgi:hypothetical protein
LYPRAASAWTTLDFPVPDMPVRSTRFTAPRIGAPHPSEGWTKWGNVV